MRRHKQLILLKLLLFAFAGALLLAQKSLVIAAPTPLPHVQQPDFLSVVPSVSAERQLVGTWVAIDSHGDLKAGAIALQSNAVAIVAPDESQPLIGTWHADAKHILIIFKHHARSLMLYTLVHDPDLLTLTFPNGTAQRFARLPVHKNRIHENKPASEASVH